MSTLGQSQAMLLNFQNHLKELPPLPMWIKNSIVTTIKEGGIIEKNVVHLSMPPTCEARSYRSMWAFGNHIRVSSVEEHFTT